MYVYSIVGTEIVEFNFREAGTITSLHDVFWEAVER